jgi:hypothetical protein
MSPHEDMGDIANEPKGAVSSRGWRTAGPTLTLLGAIDDATGTVVALYFRPAEVKGPQTRVHAAAW